MRIVTAAQMKEIEKRANDTCISYYEMMENAGTKAFDIIKNEYNGANSLLIFCGKGNNGGDGFVVARLAVNVGLKVAVVLVEGNPVTEDAETNYKKLPEAVRVYDSFESYKSMGCQGDESTNAKYDIYVDAIYGTGFHGSLRENARRVCDYINESNGKIAALDIPSGVTADTGEASEGAVNADITIAFDSWKKAHVPAAKQCGKCILADIGIPENCHDNLD